MQKFIVVLSAVIFGSFARSIPVDLPDDGSAFHVTRQKRQFGFAPQNFEEGFGQQPYAFGQNYGQSSAQANANAFNQYAGPNGFGSSNALAGAQSFQSQGPLGGFGASAANSGSQGFHTGPDGISGNAGFSGSQTYTLPGGKNIAIAYGAGYNFVPGQEPQLTNSNSIAFT